MYKIGIFHIGGREGNFNTRIRLYFMYRTRPFSETRFHLHFFRYIFSLSQFLRKGPLQSWLACKGSFTESLRGKAATCFSRLCQILLSLGQCLDRVLTVFFGYFGSNFSVFFTVSFPDNTVVHCKIKSGKAYTSSPLILRFLSTKRSVKSLKSINT